MQERIVKVVCIQHAPMEHINWVLTVVVIIIMGTTNPSMGQNNIIPNPGFEEYLNCNFLVEDKLNTVVRSWSPLVDNPKYIHRVCGEDNNAKSLFKDDGGDAYIILCNGSGLDDSSGWQIRSYITAELEEPIVEGHSYYMEYYISYDGLGMGNHSHFGVHFSDKVIRSPYYDRFPYYPLLLDPLLEVDSVVYAPHDVWKKIHHCFIADSDYAAITLGVFAPAHAVVRQGARFGVQYVGYDNLYLGEVLPSLELELSQSDTICVGSCITLSTSHSKLPTGTWFWDLPGSDKKTSTKSEVEVCYDQVGSYDIFVHYEYECQTFQDSFFKKIVVVSEIGHEPQWTDTSVCKGSFVSIDITHPDYEAEWLDGYSQNDRDLSEGQFLYSLDDGFCRDTFSLNVNNLSAAFKKVETSYFCIGDTFTFQQQKITQPRNFIDTILGQEGCDSAYIEQQIRFYPSTPWEWDGNLGYCPGKQTEIKITSNLTNITWNGESKGSSALLGIAGTVHLIARDGNGCRTDTLIEIIEYPVPEVTTENLLDILFTGPIDLPVRYNGDIVDYHWSPSQPLDCANCPYPQLTRAQEGNYYITVTNKEGCEVSETLEVRFKEAEIYFPNVIRVGAALPANGRMMMYSNFPINYDLVIFDRWGGSVYQADDLISDDPRGAWQPTQDTHLGVYTFMAKFQVNGETIVEAGTVTLIN